MHTQEHIEELTQNPVYEFEEAGDDNNGERNWYGNYESGKEFSLECNTYWLEHILTIVYRHD